MHHAPFRSRLLPSASTLYRVPHPSPIRSPMHVLRFALRHPERSGGERARVCRRGVAAPRNMTDGLYVPLYTAGFRRSASRSSRGDTQSFRGCGVDRVSESESRVGSVLCVSPSVAYFSLALIRPFFCRLPHRGIPSNKGHGERVRNDRIAGDDP